MVIEIFDRVRHVQRVIVRENQRAIALYKGKFHGILTPGEHALRADRGRLEIEWHDLSRSDFVSVYDKALFRDHVEVAREHLTEFRSAAGEVLVISRDGRFHAVLKPEGRAVYWTIPVRGRPSASASTATSRSPRTWRAGSPARS